MKSMIFILVLLSVSFGMRDRHADSVLAQVREKLQGGGPMQEIVDLLDSLKDDIQAEQVTHNEQYDKYVVDCADEKAFREGEVAEAETALARIVPEKDACLAARDASKEDLIKNRENQNNAQTAIGDAQADIADQQAKYDKEQAETRDLIAAIDECIALMQKLLNDPSDSAAVFAEVGAVSGKLLKASAKSKKTASTAPVMLAMVQVFSEQYRYSDQSAVSRVIDLFLELRATTATAQEGFLAAHNQITGDLNDLISKQEAILSDLEADEALLETHINEMDACYTQMCVDELEAIAKKDNNTELLNDAITACDDWFANYASMQADRQAEIATINTLKELVMSRLDAFGGRDEYGAMDRANQYDEDFAEYENKYVYSAPSA